MPGGTGKAKKYRNVESCFVEAPERPPLYLSLKSGPAQTKNAEHGSITSVFVPQQWRSCPPEKTTGEHKITVIPKTITSKIVMRRVIKYYCFIYTNNIDLSNAARPESLFMWIKILFHWRVRSSYEHFFQMCALASSDNQYVKDTG